MFGFNQTDKAFLKSDPFNFVDINNNILAEMPLELKTNLKSGLRKSYIKMFENQMALYPELEKNKQMKNIIKSYDIAVNNPTPENIKMLNQKGIQNILGHKFTTDPQRNLMNIFKTYIDQSNKTYKLDKRGKPEKDAKTGKRITIPDKNYVTALLTDDFNVLSPCLSTTFLACFDSFVIGCS